jgi:hypothetical protein
MEYNVTTWLIARPGNARAAIGRILESSEPLIQRYRSWVQVSGVPGSGRFSWQPDILDVTINLSTILKGDQDTKIRSASYNTEL